MFHAQEGAIQKLMRVIGDGPVLWLLRKFSFKWPFCYLPICASYRAAVQQHIVQILRDRICGPQLDELPDLDATALQIEQDTAPLE